MVDGERSDTGFGKSFDAKFGMTALAPRCSESEFNAFCDKLQRKLPEDYVAFLRQWNGVVFPVDNLAVRFLDEFDEYDFGTLHRLFGIGVEAWLFDLPRAGKAYAFELRVPDGFLAIGDDGDCDRLALCLNEDRYGHILYWSPGLPWEDGENIQTEEYLRPVARSFTEFWDGLYVSEYPPDQRTWRRGAGNSPLYAARSLGQTLSRISLREMFRGGTNPGARSNRRDQLDFLAVPS